jgi:hypothetical protein
MGIQEIICGLLKLGATCQSMPMDQLLIEYLLVPSVILIIILYLAVDLFTTRKNIKGLLAIVFYIVIIYQGWYAMIAQFVMAFLPLWLLGVIAIFFLGKIVKKSWVVEGPSKLAKTISDFKDLGKITKGKKEDMEKYLENRKKILKAEESKLRNDIRKNEDKIKEVLKSKRQASIEERLQYQDQINDLTRDIRDIEESLRKVREDINNCDMMIQKVKLGLEDKDIK